VYSAAGSFNRNTIAENTVFSFSDETSWPMFHHDPQHTGYTDADAPDTNYVKWTYQTEGSIRSSPAVVNGKLFVAAYDWYFYCLNAMNGERIWRYPMTYDMIRSSPAVANNRVYIGGWAAQWYPSIMCFNADNGSLLWEYYNETEEGDPILSSPAINNNRVYAAYSFALVGKILCLNATTGDLIWKHEIQNCSIDSSPALSNNKVYIGTILQSGNGTMYCLNETTGEELWNTTTEGYIQYSTPTVHNNKVYIGTTYYWQPQYGWVYCLNAENGSVLWRYQTNDYIKSTPAVAYDKVYVGSDDTYLYCLNADNGSRIWRFETLAAVDSSPAVADGKVYFGSGLSGGLIDGHVYCVNAETGDLIWSYATSGPVRSSPAIVNGTVFIGSYDCIMYAFEDTLELGHITGGIGVGTTLTNIGSNTLFNTEWNISVIGNGLFKKIHSEKTGVLPPLEAAGTALIRIPVFGLGKITITLTAHPSEVIPIQKTVTGFLLGPFVLIREQ
jgi:outer membrane protein assembly factor BamB